MLLQQFFKMSSIEFIIFILEQLVLKLCSLRFLVVHHQYNSVKNTIFQTEVWMPYLHAQNEFWIQAIWAQMLLYVLSQGAIKVIMITKQHYG